MSYLAYKLIHLFGILLLVVSLAAMLSRSAWGGALDGRDSWKGRLMALHGVALLLVLLGGFGLMARLGIPHTEVYPGWIFVKLSIWLLLGAMAVIPKKRPSWSVPALLFIPVLGLVAGYVALFKPF
jgi:hypothetical protein